MLVIGFLRGGSAGPVEHLMAVFRQTLTDAGYVEGHNVAIEVRSAGQFDCNRLSTMTRSPCDTTSPVSSKPNEGALPAADSCSAANRVYWWRRCYGIEFAG